MENLKKIRIEKKLTQQEIADMLGVQRPTYTRYETGEREPDLNTLRNLSAILNTSIDYLLGRSDAMHNKSNITGNKNVVQQGNVNNSPVTISDVLSPPLSEQETELLNIFRLLTPKEKHKVMTLIYEIEDENKKSK